MSCYRRCFQSRFFLPRGLAKRFSKGLHFVDLGGLFYKTKTPVNFTSVCAEERFGLVF